MRVVLWTNNSACVLVAYVSNFHMFFIWGLFWGFQKLYEIWSFFKFRKCRILKKRNNLASLPMISLIFALEHLKNKFLWEVFVREWVICFFCSSISVRSLETIFIWKDQRKTKLTLKVNHYLACRYDKEISKHRKLSAIF